jgi:hypothetical protein
LFALRAGRESSAATRRPPAPPGVRPTPGKFVALGPARHGLSLDALAGEIRRARPCEDSGFGGQWGTLLTLPARRLCHQHPTGSVSGPGRLRAPPAEPRSRGSRGDLSRWRPLRDIFRARVRLSGEIRRASRSFARRPRGYRSQAVDGRVGGPPSGALGRARGQFGNSATQCPRGRIRAWKMSLGSATDVPDSAIRAGLLARPRSMPPVARPISPTTRAMSPTSASNYRILARRISPACSGIFDSP